MYVKRLGILLITVALIVVMGGCALPSQNLEIRDWYDLDDIRNNLGGHHILMNDLDSTTAGYEELASETANQGKGWQPIGTSAYNLFWGEFDGQGYEIRDLFINRPHEYYVGLFGLVGYRGVIKDVGVVNFTVSGSNRVGGLVGENLGTVSNSYSTGNVTGDEYVGGLVGYNEQSSVENTYSTGSVIGKEDVGGLVGENNNGSAPTPSGISKPADRILRMAGRARPQLKCRTSTPSRTRRRQGCMSRGT